MWLLNKKTKDLSSFTKIDLGDLQFTINNKMVMKEITFMGETIIESISFSDKEPPGLSERFNEAYFGLESQSFGRTEKMNYSLSAELGKNKTVIFANAQEKNKRNSWIINFIITGKESTITIEAIAKTNLKEYWGLTCQMCLPKNVTVDEKQKDAKTRRSHYEASMQKELKGNIGKAVLETTYGYFDVRDSKNILMMPTITGTDREVVNSWRVKSNLKNYNVIKLSFKKN